MSNELGTVNSQIVDSVTNVVTLLSSQAPSQSFGMLDAVMAETLGMAMHNAVSRQQGASVISSAAVTAACARMLMARLPGPLPPDPAPPPIVIPLPGPVLPPDAALAAAFSQAETAIDALKTQGDAAASQAQQAQNDLDQLIQEAGGTPPLPPDAALAAAFSQAETAIDVLKTQGGAAAGQAQQAQNDLDQLIQEAGGTPPSQPVIEPGPGPAS
jgi:hypothetical protein